MEIPIYIICFNNGWQVENTVHQLSKFKHEIYIIDNASTSFRTKRVLARLASHKRCKVIRMKENYGHTVLWRDEIYSTLPQYFALTDPDLAYSSSLPPDFIEVLAKLTTKYKVHKAGLALEIPASDQTYSDIYYKGKNIRDWELQFWDNKLKHSSLEIYSAPVDTTFAVYNKKINNDHCCRVAGNYTARHLPWYIDHNNNVPMIDIVDTYSMTKGSTISQILLKDFQNKFPHLHFLSKNKLKMLVELDGSETREGFWKNYYSNWEPDTFRVFDRYAKDNEVAIDVGSWIGPTVLYLAQKCQRVISIEADYQASSMLKRNIKYNSIENKVKVIEKAIYRDDRGVWFGPNTAREDDGLNASTSQIISNNEHANSHNYFTPSITWLQVVKHLRLSETVCLIKVDIEGGEEFILRDVLRWAFAHGVPAYISFHYSWWKEQNLERFQDLFELFGMNTVKEQILKWSAPAN